MSKYITSNTSWRKPSRTLSFPSATFSVFIETNQGHMYLPLHCSSYFVSVMEKLHKSQLLTIALILILVIVTPFIPTSLRPSYLYFLFNTLLMVLFIEAGLLSAVDSRPCEDQRVTLKSSEAAGVVTGLQHQVMPAEKPAAVEKNVAVARVHKVRKSTSTPSLFFIGGSDADEGVVEEEEMEMEMDVEEEVDMSAQELFAKAEMFIGNFYKQLKMQREESWKKIHGLYNRAF